MKKTIVKICIIFLLLFFYCTSETIFLNSFTQRMTQMVFQLQNEKDIENMYNIYLQMEAQIEDRKIWLDLMIPKTELDMINLSLGRVGDCLEEKQGFEARVSAGEVLHYLKNIH